MATIINSVQNSAITPTISVTPTQSIGNPAQDTNLRLDQLILGKSLQGQILSISNDGHAQVSITAGHESGSQVKVNIPSGYKVGDQIALSLLSNDANQPKFSVSLLSPQSENLQLSIGALILNQVLQSSSETSTVQSTTPLLASPVNIDPAQLAVQLKQTLTLSGVFYESHLKQWNDGTRTIADIRLEPQNQSLDSQTATTLLPAQLGVIENKNLMWFGPIWPDQQMAWDVTQDQGRNPSTEEEIKDEKNNPWSTSIRLTMPNLGTLVANVRLNGNHAELMLQSDKPEVVVQLLKQKDTLDSALASAGIVLDNFTAYS